MTYSGVKEKVEGDYEQTSPPSSNDWHFVKITAKPGSDKVFTIDREYVYLNLRVCSNLHFHYSPSSSAKVFIWKNKAGVEWELILTNMEENDGVLVFKVGRFVEL